MLSYAVKALRIFQIQPAVPSMSPCRADRQQDEVLHFPNGLWEDKEEEEKGQLLRFVLNFTKTPQCLPQTTHYFSTNVALSTINQLKNEQRKACSLARKWGFPGRHFTKSLSRTHTVSLCTMPPPTHAKPPQNRPTNPLRISDR